MLRSLVGSEMCIRDSFLSLLMLFVSCLFFLLFSKSFFISFRSLLGSILSSQADLPTLKNLDFASAGARFLKNEGLRYKDGCDDVLGLSWARFWCSRGLLGSSFPALGDSQWLLEFSELLFGPPCALILAPKEPSTGPRSSPGALLARQMAPRSYRGPSGDVFQPLFLRF